MLGGFGTQSFGDAWWGWYSACVRIWGCPLESVPGMRKSLGMCLGIGTQNLLKDAGAGGHHPLHRQLRGPCGGKSAFSFSPPAPPGSSASRWLLRLPAEASHATSSSYDNAES